MRMPVGPTVSKAEAKPRIIRWLSGVHISAVDRSAAEAQLTALQQSPLQLQRHHPRSTQDLSDEHLLIKQELMDVDPAAEFIDSDGECGSCDEEWEDFNDTGWCKTREQVSVDRDEHSSHSQTKQCRARERPVQHTATQTDSPSCCAAVLSQLQALHRELLQCRRSLLEALASRPEMKTQTSDEAEAPAAQVDTPISSLEQSPAGLEPPASPHHKPTARIVVSEDVSRPSLGDSPICSPEQPPASQKSPTLPDCSPSPPTPSGSESSFNIDDAEPDSSDTETASELGAKLPGDVSFEESVKDNIENPPFVFVVCKPELYDIDSEDSSDGMVKLGVSGSSQLVPADSVSGEGSVHNTASTTGVFQERITGLQEAALEGTSSYGAEPQGVELQHMIGRSVTEAQMMPEVPSGRTAADSRPFTAQYSAVTLVSPPGPGTEQLSPFQQLQPQPLPPQKALPQLLPLPLLQFSPASQPPPEQFIRHREPLRQPLPQTPPQQPISQLPLPPEAPPPSQPSSLPPPEPLPPPSQTTMSLQPQPALQQESQTRTNHDFSPTGLCSSLLQQVSKRKCKQCGQRFLESHHLKRHMMIHTGEKPFSCPTCHKKFARNDNLKKHVKIHSSLREAHTPPSDSHILTGKAHTPPSDSHTPTSKAHTTTDALILTNKAHTLTNNAHTHSSKGQLVCQKCRKCFLQVDELRSHMQMAHSRAYVLYCPVCLTLCSDPNILSSHISRHKDLGQMWSKDANQCLVQLSNHPDLLPGPEKAPYPTFPSHFQCDVCDKMFVDPCGLSMHKAVMHLQPRCGRCDGNFCSLIALMVHQRTCIGLRLWDLQSSGQSGNVVRQRSSMLAAADTQAGSTEAAQLITEVPSSGSVPNILPTHMDTDGEFRPRQPQGNTSRQTPPEPTTQRDQAPELEQLPSPTFLQHAPTSSHMNLQWFTCGKCGASFKNESNLKRHSSVVHLKHKCKYCHDRFATNDSLESHLLTSSRCLAARGLYPKASRQQEVLTGQCSSVPANTDTHNARSPQAAAHLSSSEVAVLTSTSPVVYTID